MEHFDTTIEQDNRVSITNTNVSSDHECVSEEAVSIEKYNVPPHEGSPNPSPTHDREGCPEGSPDVNKIKPLIHTNIPSAKHRPSRSFLAVDKAAEKFGTAIENELHKKLNVVYVALLGFVIIGLCAICCIAFGIVEITQNDRIFSNLGLGEVLTVLGTYFMVPYIFIIVAFGVLTHNNKCVTAFGAAIALRSTPILVGICIFFYIVQQGFTNAYLVILTGSKLILFIIIADLGTLIALIYYWRRPYGHMIHLVLFTAKLAIQWNHAYETQNQPVLGPNGVNVMLYLCVPLVQLPLHAAFIRDDSEEKKIDDVKSNDERASPIEEKQRKFLARSPTSYIASAESLYSSFMRESLAATSSTRGPRERGRQTRKRANEFVESYAANFNLYLSHLLHSLDIFSLYAYSFVVPGTTSSHIETPAPFRTLLTFLFCIAFMVNNISVLFLFFKRPGSEDAVIPGFPRNVLEAASGGPAGRRAQSVSAGDTLGLRGLRGCDPEEDRRLRGEASHHTRMFQYMLLMVVVCDIPLLIARIQLWWKSYAPISIFIAKNIKEIIDVCMVMLRVSELNDVNKDTDAVAPFASFIPGRQDDESHVSFGRKKEFSHINFLPLPEDNTINNDCHNDYNRENRDGNIYVAI